MHASSLGLNAAHTLCTKSSLILAHFSSTAAVRVVTYGYGTLPTFLSTAPQMPKSSGLLSGEDGSHKLEGQKSARFSSNHCCVALTV